MISWVPWSYFRLSLLLGPLLIKEEGLTCPVVPERQKATQFWLVLAGVTAAFWEFPEGTFWKWVIQSSGPPRSHNSISFFSAAEEIVAFHLLRDAIKSAFLIEKRARRSRCWTQGEQLKPTVELPSGLCPTCRWTGR